METVRDFILGAPKSLQMVTVAMKLKDACSLGRKARINLVSLFKSRDITLPTKVHLVKTMVFPVSCMDMKFGPSRNLSAKEFMLLYCGVGKGS